MPMELAELLGIGALPRYRVLRGPEAGLVMVRGRAGGGGAPFNLGEMTVTRCTVRTDGGLRRPCLCRRPRANGRRNWRRWPMRCCRTRRGRPRCCDEVIEPLAAAQQARRDAIAAKAAATRVQFFAMRNMRS